MPYTNVDIFREKGAKRLKKKVWEPLNFMNKSYSLSSERLVDIKVTKFYVEKIVYTYNLKSSNLSLDEV
jgi:hypothetical protein